MKKTLLSLVIAIATLLSLASCSSDDSSSDASKPDSSVSDTSAAESKADESEASSTDIADSNVSFESTCEDEIDDTDLILFVKNNGVDADSYWYFYYGENGAEIKIYVNDLCLISDGENTDGIAFLLAESSNSSSWKDGKAVKVTVPVKGDMVAKVYENGDFTKDATVTSSVQGWKSGDSKGYVVSVEVPYDVIGMDSESAYANLGIAPQLSNCNGSDTTTEFSEEFNCDPTAPNGLIKVIDDDTYQANPYSGVVVLGPCDSANPVVGAWDTTADYAPDDANYSDRKVTLNANGTGTIYFTGMSSPILYAEGTFKINAIKNNDPWCKFGFVFNDGTQNGLFCFIDAGTGDGAKNQLTDIIKDDAGYVHVENGDYAWTETEKINWPTGWTYDQEVKLSVFRNGDTVIFYVNDAPTYTIVDVPALTDDSEATVGFNVFNLDLEITDYRCSTDINDEKIQELLNK